MKIEFMDKYNISDDSPLLKKYVPKYPGPIGWVKVYLDNKLMEESSNLVVVKGREFVAQKLFDVAETEDGSTVKDYRNYKVSHFSVGAGGATVTGNNFTLQGPEVCDTRVYQAINLGNTLYFNEPTTYNLNDPVEDPYGILNSNYAVKPILNDGGSIKLVSADYSGVCSGYTVMKCVCIVPPGEPQGLDPGASVPISEAGLYILDYTDPANPTDPVLFAHICFAPKFKEKESELKIEWSILC